MRVPINLTNYVLNEYEDIDQHDPYAIWSKFIQYQIKSLSNFRFDKLILH